MQHDRHPTTAALTDTRRATDANAIGRRRLLGMFGAAVGATLVAACAEESTSPASSGGDTAGSTAGTGATQATSAPSGASTTAAATPGTTVAPAPVDVGVTPSETGGPFPSDGSNDNGDGEVANMLAKDGAIRRDIRADIGGANEQEGVPMSLSVVVVDAATDTPKPGAAVYIWHCNKAGAYSQYDSPMLGGDFSDFTWLRGVQVADADGVVTFLTILPGRYQGRAAHIHFQVYGDDSFGSLLLTSQMAFDDDVVDALYASAGYTDALDADTGNDEDGIFSDGVDDQLLTITGDVTTGLSASIVVGV